MREIPATDLLDELLSTLSIRAHIAFRGLACERWGIGGPTQGRLGFHLVLCGECLARLPEVSQPVVLSEGALLLYRASASHLLADSADTGVVIPARIAPLSREESAPHVGLLCGYFDGAGTRSPLMEAMPAYLLWPDYAALPASLAPMVHMLVACAHDTSRCGEQVLARLCEVLLLMILRDPSVVPRERIAPLRARCDPALRRAFDSIHAQPGKRWTLAALARNAGLSRSAFAQRFTEVAGVPAMTYLRRHRLALAEKHMSDGMPLERAARAMGYRSVAAFRRARLRGRSETES
jgi:AraC family transcriptional regulator, activator of mtrCDE